LTKILFVIGTLDVGGTERQLVELLTRLDRRRFEPVVCCLAAGGALEEPLRRAGVSVHVAGFRGFLRFRGLAFFVRLPKLLSELGRFVLIFRRERPDIVHGFLFWAYVLGAYAARLARVPVVITSRRGLSHFKSGKPAFLLMERVANRLTDLVIANSEAVRQDAIAAEGLAAGKVIVIHNGIEAARYCRSTATELRAELAIGQEALVVAVVANLIHYKGHRYLIEAWVEVCRVVPGAVCVLVGEGPVRAALERASSDLGLRESIRFLGTRHDVPAVVAAADLLVHPSLEEGFSNAILEAMAAGKAVVATRVGGNPEAVLDGRTGVLVPPADPRALAGAVIDLLSDSGKRAAMGAAGRRRAAEVFPMEVMVDRYQQVYDELLPAPGKLVGSR